MKRTMILAVIALAGCRSSQQPTNPFLRTTVPPPGTGEAAVVVPGDPYYPGGTPTPSPAVPAAPTPVAPAPVAQPVVPPPAERNKPVPGGDFFYHQSSVERPQGSEPGEEEESWSDEQSDIDGTPGIAVNAAAPGAIRLGGTSDAVAQAIALSKEPEAVPAADFTDFGGTLPGENASQGEAAESSLDEDADTAPDLDRASSAEPTARTGVA